MFRLQQMFMLAILALFYGVLTQSVKALELPQVFATNMVLQRDMPVCIWGKAQTDSTVFVFFEKQRAVTVADHQGNWTAWLQPLAVNRQPQTLKIFGDGVEITYENVLVGDVWLCSGQSNMEWPVRGADEADELIATAKDPLLRLCDVGRRYAASPQFNTYMRWAECDSNTIGGFSAVGYYFGKNLREKLDIPIGLIKAAWGGTPCEAWTSKSALDANPKLVSVRELWEKQVADYPERVTRWQKASEEAYQKQMQWLKDNPGEDAIKAQNKFRMPRKPYPPDATPFAPSVLFNGMIAPVLPFSMKGAIWYQGEANAGRPDEYRELLPTMIKDWRDRMASTPLPFGIVQLANFREPLDHNNLPEDAGWAHLRDAQKHTAQTMSDVGMVTIIDIGEAKNIHPRNKRDVGKRLSLWAIHDVYGMDIAHTGPVFDSATVNGGRMLLQFTKVGSGLKTADDKPLTEFILADSNRNWHWAQAKIIGKDTIEVWCDAVPNPVAVRYAWAINPAAANLTNDSGLPASPFRTDDWPFAH
jgi:sialate O-acetylesterase